MDTIIDPAVALALTSHYLPTPAPVGPKIWRAIKDRADSLESVEAWARQALPPGDAEIVLGRLSLVDSARDALEELAQDGIRVVTESEEGYPQRWSERLREKRPPLLFVAGETSLLNSTAVGVVGSRDVDAGGSEFAASISAEIASLGYAVVSGGARGVDRIAMEAAYEHGVGSIGILADSLRRTIRTAETRRDLESGLACLATPYSPDAPFQVGNAMGRNKLVYGLSVATVVVAASEGKGGTWSGAVEALEMDLCPVLVRAGRDAPAAHERLVRKGGIPIESRDQLAELLAGPSLRQSTLFN